MNTPEKLDLLLKELYTVGPDAELSELYFSCRNAGISLQGTANLKSLAKKLASKQLIELTSLLTMPRAKITLAGMIFCETTSFMYEGYPIITHVTNSILESSVLV